MTYRQYIINLCALGYSMRQYFSAAAFAAMAVVFGTVDTLHFKGIINLGSVLPGVSSGASIIFFLGFLSELWIANRSRKDAAGSHADLSEGNQNG